MTGAELKAQARAQLGGGIFKNEWLTALAVCFIAMAICSAAGGLLPGVGALILTGPMTYGVAYVFLKQSRDGQPMNVADVFRGFPEDFGGTLLLALKPFLRKERQEKIDRALHAARLASLASLALKNRGRGPGAKETP